MRAATEQESQRGSRASALAASTSTTLSDGHPICTHVQYFTGCSPSPVRPGTRPSCMHLPYPSPPPSVSSGSPPSRSFAAPPAARAFPDSGAVLAADAPPGTPSFNDMLSAARRAAASSSAPRHACRHARPPPHCPRLPLRLPPRPPLPAGASLLLPMPPLAFLLPASLCPPCATSLHPLLRSHHGPPTLSPAPQPARPTEALHQVGHCSTSWLPMPPLALQFAPPPRSSHSPTRPPTAP